MYTANNRFAGFCVDLLEMIKEDTGYNYSLYLVPDRTYGPGPVNLGLNVSPTGLIGEVYNKKAAFAIADMTMNSMRAQYVQFTRPFLTFSISAIVQRKYAHNLANIDDLAVKTSTRNLTIGTYRNGNTMNTMSRLKQSIRNIRWLYTRMLSNESNLVSSSAQALDKVVHEPFAFVQEEPKNMYWAKKNCALKVLPDQNAYYVGQYGIAFHHQADPNLVGAFNRSIEHLAARGKLRRLKRKYFAQVCSASVGLEPATNLLWIVTTVVAAKIFF